MIHLISEGITNKGTVQYGIIVKLKLIQKVLNGRITNKMNIPGDRKTTGHFCFLINFFLTLNKKLKESTERFKEISRIILICFALTGNVKRFRHIAAYGEHQCKTKTSL